MLPSSLPPSPATETDLTGLQYGSASLQPGLMVRTFVLCARNKESFGLLMTLLPFYGELEYITSVTWAQGQPRKFNCSSALVKN